MLLVGSRVPRRAGQGTRARILRSFLLLLAERSKINEAPLLLLVALRQRLLLTACSFLCNTLCLLHRSVLRLLLCCALCLLQPTSQCTFFALKLLLLLRNRQRPFLERGCYL